MSSSSRPQRANATAFFDYPQAASLPRAPKDLYVCLSNTALGTLYYFQVYLLPLPGHTQ